MRGSGFTRLQRDGEAANVPAMAVMTRRRAVRDGRRPVKGARAWKGGIAAALLLALAAVALSGCGGSKPEYCEKATELRESVQALTEVNLSKEGVAGAEAALRKIHTSATALVEAAKSEFPQQTEAISSSANALAESVKAATNAQTRSSAISQIPAEIAALSVAANNFVEATKSKCE